MATKRAIHFFVDGNSKSKRMELTCEACEQVTSFDISSVGLDGAVDCPCGKTLIVLTIGLNGTPAVVGPIAGMLHPHSRQVGKGFLRTESGEEIPVKFEIVRLGPQGEKSLNVAEVEGGLHYVNELKGNPISGAAVLVADYGTEWDVVLDGVRGARTGDFGFEIKGRRKTLPAKGDASLN